MVVQQGRTAPKTKGGISSEDVTNMIRYGADRIFRQTGSTITEEDIDIILARGETKTQELNSKFQKHVGLMDLSFSGAAPAMTIQENTDMTQFDHELAISMNESYGKRERKKVFYIGSTA